MEEVAEHRALMKELKAKMKCPVCFSIPREGPVPCCPRGHLVCNGCFETMREGGQRACPTCRAPMGEGKSLLGKVLVENMKHQCECCKKMMPFKTLKQHQMECNYRRVVCPGGGALCKELVPFCEVENHASTCLEIKPCEAGSTRYFAISHIPHITYTSDIVNIGNEVFFLRARKEADSFIAEVVMKADQEICNKFTATISILDSKSKPVYTFSFSPRPLGPSNEEDACLSVRMKSLAKVWQEEEDGKYCFKVGFVVKENESKESESDMEEMLVSDGELEWLEDDLASLIAMEGPRTKTIHLLRAVQINLQEVRGKPGRRKSLKKADKPGYKQLSPQPSDFRRMKMMMAELEADGYRSESDVEYHPGDEVEQVDVTDEDEEEATESSFFQRRIFDEDMD